MNDAKDIQNILDTLSVLFIQKDKVNNIVRTNHAAATTVGATVESLVGTPTSQWFPDVGGDYFRDDLKVMQSGKSSLGIIELLQIEGADNRWTSTDKYPHFDSLGEVDGLLVFIHDITKKASLDQRRIVLEEKMQEAQKLEGIGVLAAGVAHDFNNHLMAVMGNAEIATTLIGSSHIAVKNLKEILAVSRQAAEICNQLLTYAGQKKFQLQPTNLSDLVGEVSHLLSVAISKKSLLTLNLAAELPVANVDSPQISQILVNLMTNASEAIGESGGEITVTTSSRYCDEAELLKTVFGADLAPGYFVSIAIKDSGCGMSKDALAQLFQPFYTTKSTGRGLGLAAVLGTVRSHSGTIRVTSTLKVGTVLELLFPVSDNVVILSAPLATSTSLHTNGTILLADDEPAVRAVLQTILEGAGYTVLTAVDGIDAVELFTDYEGSITGAVLDYSMPGKNGVEAYVEICRQQPTLPVLFSSGYPEAIATDKLVPINGVDFIQKPYSSEDLLLRLHNVIKRPHRT